MKWSHGMRAVTDSAGSLGVKREHRGDPVVTRTILSAFGEANLQVDQSSMPATALSKPLRLSHLNRSRIKRRARRS